MITRWQTFEDRFWSRIDKSDGCWLWTGGRDYKGYGTKVGFQGRAVRPHRLMYELHVGPIPEGMVIDHLCRVRHCVNPHHLEAVTQEENTRRGVEARWVEPCPNGHDPKISRKTLPSGKNVCVECRRISDAERYQRDGERRRKQGRERYKAHGRRVGSRSMDEGN